MNAHDLIASPLVYRLGWTLLHSLWQGAALAGLLALLLWLLSRASANTRYLTASAALLLTLTLSVATFLLVSAPQPQVAALTDPTLSLPQSASASPSHGEPTSAAGSPSVGATVAQDPARHSTVRSSVWSSAFRRSSITSTSLRSRVGAWTATLQPALPWFVGAWVLGVLGLSLWHLGGCIAVQRLKSLGTHPADSQTHALLTRLTRRMNLRRPVRLLQSALVETPVVFGCLRPIILIPASVLTGLAPAQLEAILAHELAHVRRHDYLVNLLQTVIETLLFYHPAIWWISRQVRREREHCCDDIAVQVCGDRLTYTTALAAIEEVRGTSPAAALAAGGNNHGELLGRIQRLLGLPGRRPAGALLAACLVIGLLLVSLFSGALAAPATRTTQDQRIDELLYVLRHSVLSSRVDQWAGAIKKLAEIGKPAVPALVRELDRADGFFEKSAIAFTLRAINDPRAVPSLIRALPRSAEQIGGWGLIASDLELHRFMRQHAAFPPGASEEHFGFQGPQVELERTLARITGHSEGDVYPKSNSPTDQEAAGKLRLELPGKWRSWWAANHQKFVTDAELATLESQSSEKQDAVEAAGLAKSGPLFPAGPDVHLGPVHDLVLPAETSIDVKAHLDFDTGRRFSQFEGSRRNSDRDYPRWLQQAGIDARVLGNNLFGADIHAWMVDNTLWDKLPDELARQSTIDPGLKGPSSDFYPRRSEGEARLEPDALPATLLFTTREGGRGILQILQALSEDKQPKGLHIRYRMFQSPRLPIVKAATLSTQPVPAALSFGPERQVTLHDPRSDKDAALNFDTGKTLALPAGAYEAGYENWLNASDASIMVLTDTSREILAAIRSTKVSIQKVAPDAWDHLTPAEVVDLASRFPPASDNLQALSIFPSLPNTAVFQTPNGTVGLVQIIEANGVTGKTSSMTLSEGNYPKTLKLRYKLVLDAKPADRLATQPAATQPATTQPAQVSNVGEVVASLKAELVKISKDYPELNGVADRQLDIDAQGGIWSLSFFHNCKYLAKRGYEDTGPNPAAVTFRITTPATYLRELSSTEMQMPWRDVRNRRFIVADRVYFGKAPTTPGFEPAVRALLEQHVAMLDELGRTMPAPAGPIDPNKEWVAGAKAFVDQLRAETYAQSVTMMADWKSNYFYVGNYSPTPTFPDSTVMIVNGRRFAKLMDDTAGARWSSQRTWTLEFLNADIVRWGRLYQQGQRPNEGPGFFSKPGTNSDELIIPLMFRMNSVLLLIAQHPEPASLPSVVKYVQGLGEHANFAVAALAADRIMSVTDLSAWNAPQRKVLEQYQTWKKMPEANAFTTYATVEFPSYRELSRPQLRAGSTGLPSKSETPADNISVVTPQMYTVHIVLAPSGSRTYSDGNSGKTALAKAIVDFAQRVVLAGNL